MRQNISKVLGKLFNHFQLNITGVKMSIQFISITLLMVIKVEHALVVDGRFDDENSASLSDQVNKYDTAVK